MAFPVKTELIEEIMAFDIDGGPAKLSFAKRLARENQWSLAFAQRVIHEYKRFVVLATVSSRQVTPSEQVDQAWHLHLCYTVSYWERMHKLLPFPLHHHPTAGGSAEGDKFEDQYGATLQLYREVFGEDPPSDIWPSAKERFGHDLAWARINLNDCLVLPRRAIRSTGLIAGTLLLIFVATGCVIATAQSESGDSTVWVLALGVLAALVILIAWLSQLASKAGGGGKGSSHDSSISGCGAGFAGSDDSYHGSHHDSGSDSFGDSGGSDGGGGDGGGGCGGGGCGGGCGGGGD